MAKYKVDPSKIDGFDGMTAEEKVAALLGQEIEVETPPETSDIAKLKNAYNKACEEAGNYRKQLREKQPYCSSYVYHTQYFSFSFLNVLIDVPVMALTSLRVLPFDNKAISRS